MKPTVPTNTMIVAIMLSGCMQTTSIDEAVDEGLSTENQSTIVGENSLTTNAIDLNGLLPNAIDLNGLDPSLLSNNVLSALEDPGQLGTNTRLIYKYIVGCALDTSQSISFSWTDSLGIPHLENYWGALGLASAWKLTSIDELAQRAVSACLAARTNYYGIPVTISIRGPQPSISDVDAAEQLAFPKEEGAFWGDLFDGSPQLYACHNSANIANSRSKLRDCAAGHSDNGQIVECGYIKIVGDCDALCAALDPNDLHRPNCYDDEIGTTTTDVVTVFLPQ